VKLEKDDSMLKTIAILGFVLFPVAAQASEICAWYQFCGWANFWGGWGGF
jgi:hypothetical protein